MVQHHGMIPGGELNMRRRFKARARKKAEQPFGCEHFLRACNEEDSLIFKSPEYLKPLENK